ncbi:hypothetical protein NEOLI_005148 [Neolecta irregularis DAH-3]|uniref:Uncharacterized protein n=1 Tax=Neolecta irregularis (strain DAH-3) TaxID=1198029 RepID=A0A1U7LIR2_NEOID|nr:hypothetical protein NEOLI_005148 [Neolecta irregularis DAH-3]|eukprot:OLL22483.1 hypothetical protein NEOLI_005148 [Neolecta irregularis DAH-3]
MEDRHSTILPQEQVPFLSLDPENSNVKSDRSSSVIEEDVDIEQELEEKWVRNLSMHFRDGSKREKFFFTYFKTPHVSFRVTVSMDYTSPPTDSLELELSKLKYQRDKSRRIYEAIRTCLEDIEFYPTVTNLKLKTDSKDGHLQVKVTEDINEIIPYPLLEELKHHVDPVTGEKLYPIFNQSEIDFDNHMRGFVYQMYTGNEICIKKKEIPGPNSIAF